MILGTHLSFYKLIKDLKVRPKTMKYETVQESIRDILQGIGRSKDFLNSNN